MKKLLPVAVLSALAGVNGAHAVHVNSDGLGQVLLYPFYTVEGGQDTYINLVNTTSEVKAVKVRLLESMNSQEVLDFNLYLSPWDHWSAVITASADGATITSADTSCTVPQAISNGQTIAFRNFEYSDDSEDGLDRTREGYVEVIEMGTLFDVDNPSPAPDDEYATWATHVSGTPDDCAALDAAWGPSGSWTANSNNGVSAPSGGLYGYGVLINVAEGTDATYDALALDNFADPFFGGIHTDPGSLSPSLNSGTDEYAVIDGDTVYQGFASDPIDAVSATLMHDTISNDYVLEPTIAAGTDWVVTFPTKREYVNFMCDDDMDPMTPDVPCANPPFTAGWDPETSTSCESFGIVYWDREEGLPSAPPSENDFSPRPPGVAPAAFALCAEANVMTFNQSNVLEASGRSGTNLNLESGWDNGWARMNFFNPPAMAPSDYRELDASDHLFYGLPVTGFAVQKYVNGDVGGLLSNYAGSVTHKATRDIVVVP